MPSCGQPKYPGDPGYLEPFDENHIEPPDKGILGRRLFGPELTTKRLFFHAAICMAACIAAAEGTVLALDHFILKPIVKSAIENNPSIPHPLSESIHQ